jgi:hypothetical protein
VILLRNSAETPYHQQHDRHGPTASPISAHRYLLLCHHRLGANEYLSSWIFSTDDHTRQWSGSPIMPASRTSHDDCSFVFVFWGIWVNDHHHGLGQQEKEEQTLEGDRQADR